MLKLTQTFYKILNVETGNWFSTKNSKASWSRLSGAKTVMTTNELDPTVYEIYEFVAVGSPIKEGKNNA